jgi:hypothetical protein
MAQQQLLDEFRKILGEEIDGKVYEPLSKQLANIHIMLGAIRAALEGLSAGGKRPTRGARATGAKNGAAAGGGGGGGGAKATADDEASRVKNGFHFAKWAYKNDEAFRNRFTTPALTAAAEADAKIAALEAGSPARHKLVGQLLWKTAEEAVKVQIRDAFKAWQAQRAQEAQAPPLDADAGAEDGDTAE